MTLSLAALDIAESTNPVVISHNIEELTTVSLTGTGAFDVMMRSAKLHLKEEYDSRRITGKEYAQVYLGMVTAVLQQAVTYTLQQTQVEKTQAEIALVRQQLVTELAQTDDQIPLGLGFNDSVDIEGMVAKQKIVLDKQIEQSDAEIGLIEQKTVTELAQTDNAIPVDLGFNNTTLVEGMIAEQKTLIAKQIDQVDAEIDLTHQKTITELAHTDNIVPLGVGLNSTSSIAGLVLAQRTNLEKQTDKIDSEIELLDQKTITELSQTADTLVSGVGLNTSTVVAGTVAKQKDLYKAQTDGFARDAEQKLAKIMTEVWSVQRSTDEAFPVPAKLDNTAINTVIVKAATGIGTTL